MSGSTGAVPPAAFSLTPKPLASSPAPAAATIHTSTPPAATQAIAPLASLSIAPKPVQPVSAGLTAAAVAPSTTFTSAATPITFAPIGVAAPVAQTNATQQATTQLQQPASLAAFSLQPKPLNLQPQTVAPTAAAAANTTAAASVASGASVVPPCPAILADLPVVDDEKALEQCQEWSFFVELINDVFVEREKTLAQMDATITANDHLQFQKESHALKGAALNLHLPALVDITRKAEAVGKQLVLTPNAQEYLDIRRPMYDHLVREYERLEAVLPEYRLKAEEEMDEDQEEEYEDEEQ